MFSMVLLVLAGAILASSVKVVSEYERVVVFRLGRCVGVRGPGLIILIPFIEQAMRVGLRTVTMDIQPQDIITKDNVTVKVNAVVYFRVVEPLKAVLEIEDYYFATSQLAQTTLRAVLGQVPLDELLSDRDSINQKLQEILDTQTGSWGVKVSMVEVKNIDLPIEMQRAMAKEAESERIRRSTLISAEGEVQRSSKLAEAGRVVGESPGALQLAYLQSLREIASDKSNVIIFPLPVDLLQNLNELMKK